VTARANQEMIEDLEKELASFMNATKDLKFDFARIAAFPYDDSYYDSLEEQKALIESQLKIDVNDDVNDDDNGSEAHGPEGPAKQEPQERLLLAIFFTEDLYLRRLEYIVWPNGKVLPYKIERHSWTLMPYIETWAIQHVMSFKSFFVSFNTK